MYSVSSKIFMHTDSLLAEVQLICQYWQLLFLLFIWLFDSGPQFINF